LDNPTANAATDGGFERYYAGSDELSISLGLKAIFM
jgi:hypothetical protein